MWLSEPCRTRIRMPADMVEDAETGGPVTGIAVVGRTGQQLRCRSAQAAEVLAEPLTHLLDRLVHLGYAPGAQDERVLPFGHRVDLGGDLEVREPAAELGAVVGEGLVLAVVDAVGGRPVRSAFAICGSAKSTAGSAARLLGRVRGCSAEHLVVVLVLVDRGFGW